MNFFSDANRNNYNFNNDIFKNTSEPKKQYRCLFPFCCSFSKCCSCSSCNLSCLKCSNCPSCSCCSNVKKFSKSHPYYFALIITSIFIIILILIIVIAVAANKGKNKNKKENQDYLGEVTQEGDQEYLKIYNNIGDNDKGTLSEFCSYLSSKASHLNEEQKVKLAYKWITANIIYDLDYVKGNEIDGRDPDKFFQDRRTVCSGYAHLLYRLLIAMNYEEENIRNITGYSKGNGYSVYVEPNKSDHEWNAVKINGKWCLLDATWDYNKTDYNYFCNKPECFVRDHFPDKDENQFLDNPISKLTFHNYVSTTGAFCKFNSEINEDKSIYNSCSGKFTVKYDVDYETILQIQNDQNVEVRQKNITKGFEVEYLVNVKGQYELNLFMLNENLKLPNIATIYLNCNKD